jgi:hypothetical protein
MTPNQYRIFSGETTDPNVFNGNANADVNVNVNVPAKAKANRWNPHSNWSR